LIKSTSYEKNREISMTYRRFIENSGDIQGICGKKTEIN
jgi:hypothetical protein